MISLLTPSRGRLWSLKRLTDSVFTTARVPSDVEVIVYNDNDDNSYDAWELPQNVRIYKPAKRQILSQLWQLAYEKAQGPIYMLCNDDVVFQTPLWDVKVKQAFEPYLDKIVLVYGDDGDPNQKKNFAAHPFIHENWVKAVGRYLPPYFSGDFVDTWLNEMADGVGRKVKINAYFEHMHPAFHKGELDLTHAERLVKHWKDNMPQKYLDALPERQADTEKLRQFIKEFKDNEGS